jgi:hypothetical protein
MIKSVKRTNYVIEYLELNFIFNNITFLNEFGEHLCKI